MSNTIDFFFEFASPYSYIAAQSLPALAARTGRTLRWRPIDMSQVWAELGVGEPYAAIRAIKRGYIVRDAARVAADRAIPFARPASFPPDATLGRLAVHGLALRDTAAAGALARAIWHRFWGEGSGIDTLDDIAAAAPDLTREQIAAATESPDARTALDTAIADAIALKCFGIPWIVAEGESYFGQDRLDILERRLSRPAA